MPAGGWFLEPATSDWHRRDHQQGHGNQIELVDAPSKVRAGGQSGRRQSVAARMSLWSALEPRPT